MQISSRLVSAARRKAPAIVLSAGVLTAGAAPAVTAFTAPAAAPAVVAMSHNPAPRMSHN